mgnify:CR=1 FL=1
MWQNISFLIGACQFTDKKRNGLLALNGKFKEIKFMWWNQDWNTKWIKSYG